MYLVKPSPVKTDYNHPTVEISAREFSETMIYGLNPIKILAKTSLVIDRACNKYFLGNR